MIHQKSRIILASLVFGTAVSSNGTVGAETSYTVLGVAQYSAQPPLHNDDGYVFINRMGLNSWAEDARFWDYDVWDTDFVNYGRYSDIVFFTGHGSEKGRLVLSEYNSPSVQNPSRMYADFDTIGNNWNGADDTNDHDFEWGIFMSCSNMIRNGWGKTLANGGHHLFGYRGVSSEPKDDLVVGDFLDRSFGNYGYSATRMVTAWQQANITWGEPNWAITGHKSNEYDYIHGVGTGATPDVWGTGDIYHWYGGGGMYLSVPKSVEQESSRGKITDISQKLKELTVVPEKLDTDSIAGSLLKKQIAAKTGKYDAKVYSDGEGALATYPSGAIHFGRQGSLDLLMMDQDTAIQKAEEFVHQHGGLPSDAYLAEVIPQTAVQYDTGNEYLSGYLVEYRHKFDGIPIEGDAGDAIKVLVDKSGVSYYFRQWRQVASSNTKQKNISVTKEAAFEKAKHRLRERVKGSEPEMKSAELVYSSKPFVIKQVVMKPAWKVTAGDVDVYIDAETGGYLETKSLLETTE